MTSLVDGVTIKTPLAIGEIVIENGTVLVWNSRYYSVDNPLLLR